MSTKTRKKINMTPKYVVYECDNCNRLFYRGVAEVLTDDGADCHVLVELLPMEGTTEVEEFPMCGCIGGDAAHTLNADRTEEVTPRADA